MPDLVIVDNTQFSVPDSDINKWSKEGINREYNSTTMAATADGISWSYKFLGSSVKIVGTIGANTRSTKFTYTVDGSDTREWQSPAFDTPHWKYHQSLFEVSDLDPSNEHTLEVKQSDLRGLGKSPVYFDYLLYTASNATEFTENTRIFIDDRDAKLEYSAFRTQDRLGTTDHFGNGITKTNNTDNVASLSFTGSKVEVYGCRDGVASSQSAFTLDSQPPSLQSSLSDPSGNSWWNQLLWESPQLDTTQQHTLKMNFVNGTGDTDGLCLDYLLVTPPQTRTTPSRPATSSGTTKPSMDSDSRSLPPYAIALIAIGGFLILASIIAGLLLFRRRRRNRLISPEIPTLEPYPAIITFGSKTHRDSYCSDDCSETYTSDTASWNASTYHLQRGAR